MALPTTATALSSGHTTDHNRWADVKAHFGALADGSDDSAAFTAALAVLSGGGILYVPPGSYKLNSDLTFPNSGIVIMGADRNYSHLRFATGKGIKGTQTARLDHCGVRDLWVDMVGTSGTGIGIDAGGLDRLMIERVKVQSFATGIKVHDVTNQYASHYDMLYNVGITLCTTGLWITGGAAQSANDGEIYGGEISGCTTGVLVDSTEINGWQMFGTALESNTTALNLKGTRSTWHPGRFEGNTNDVTFAVGSGYNRVVSHFFDPAKITDNSGGFTNNLDVIGHVVGRAERPDYIWTFDPRTTDGTCANEAQYNVYASRVRPTQTRVVTSLSFVPTISSGNVQVGIVDNLAGSLMSASATTALSTVNNLQTITLSTPCVLVRGRTYWLAIKFDNAAAAVYGNAPSSSAASSAINVDNLTKKKTGGSLPIVIGDFSGMSSTTRTPWLVTDL